MTHPIGPPNHEPIASSDATAQRLTEGAVDGESNRSADNTQAPFTGFLDYVRWCWGIGWTLAYTHVGDDRIENHWIDQWTSRQLIETVKAKGPSQTTQVTDGR